MKGNGVETAILRARDKNGTEYLRLSADDNSPALTCPRPARACNFTRDFPHYSQPRAFVLAEQSLTIRLQSIKCEVQSGALIPKKRSPSAENIASRFQARTQQVSRSNFRNITSSRRREEGKERPDKRRRDDNDAERISTGDETLPTRVRVECCSLFRQEFPCSALNRDTHAFPAILSRSITVRNGPVLRTASLRC